MPEMYSQEATALARWMLQKDPQRRPTLTQVSAPVHLVVNLVSPTSVDLVPLTKFRQPGDSNGGFVVNHDIVRCGQYGMH